MCQILSSYADDHLFIFCICQKKKGYRRKSLSAVFFIKAMDPCSSDISRHSGKVRGQTEVMGYTRDSSVNKSPFIFLPCAFKPPTLNPPSPVHLKEKYSVVSMKKICTDVYILFFPSASFFVVSFGY